MSLLLDSAMAAQAAGPDSVPLSARVLQELRSGAPDCSTSVAAVLSGVAGLVDDNLTADLGMGAQLSDDVTALAKAVTVLNGELARRVHAAAVHDVLPTSAQTVLASAKIPEGAAIGIRKAGAFGARWPEVAELLATGRVNTEVVALIARMTRTLPDVETGQILTAVAPALPHLTKAQVAQAVGLAIDLLHPENGEAREQSDWDQRGLTHSHCNGIWQFALTLPELEGAAFWATIQSLAESLRSADADDPGRPTLAQRRADAVMLLVAKAAAAGMIPTNNGVPAAAVVTIGMTEAERVANGQPRTRTGDLFAAAASAGGAPAAHVQGSDTTLGDAAARFLLCASRISGVLVDASGDGSSPLATALGLAHLLPLAEGRTKRCFTDAQRRAMALRDKGCVIPDCPVPPGECQAHHVEDWAGGGQTNIADGALVCWIHHREVDLNRRKITRTTDPHGPYWIVTPVPRVFWRRWRD